MRLSAFLVLVAVALAASGASAAQDGSLKKKGKFREMKNKPNDNECRVVTMPRMSASTPSFVHGTQVAAFTVDMTSPTASHDPAHPNAPAWFAPAAHADFSVMAATLQLARAWQAEEEATQERTTAPRLSLFWYTQAGPMKIVQCPTAHAMAYYTTSHAGGSRKVLLGLGDFDRQKETARAFCAHQAENPGNQIVGYKILKDEVRKEPEYILCHANDPAKLPLLGSTQCNVRVEVNGGTNEGPKLFIKCGTAEARWFSWDLGLANVMAGFEANIRAPRRYANPIRRRPVGVLFAELNAATGGSPALQPGGSEGGMGVPPKGDTLGSVTLESGEAAGLTAAFKILLKAENTALAKEGEAIKQALAK